MADNGWIGLLAGFLIALLAQRAADSWKQMGRRKAFLRMLQAELQEFKGRLQLAKYAPDEKRLVATVNGTLLERALTEDIWDYHFHEEMIHILADLIERVRRYNDDVRIVNAYTFGAAITAREAMPGVSQELHEGLGEDLDEISKAVDKLGQEIDRTLSAPAE